MTIGSDLFRLLANSFLLFSEDSVVTCVNFRQNTKLRQGPRAEGSVTKSSCPFYSCTLNINCCCLASPELKPRIRRTSHFISGN